MDAATRERLGEMFCGWYIRRDDPAHFIDFRDGDTPENADPVRVRDLANEDIQAKLATFIGAGGVTIWDRIVALMGEFARADRVVLAPPVWDIDGHELLDDWTHRTCAAYLQDPPRVELNVVPLGVPDENRDDVKAIREAIRREVERAKE
jgi:hypothetical protein